MAEEQRLVAEAEAERHMVEWVAHDFEIISDEDINSSNRVRRRISVVSPTAQTAEARITTMMHAVRQSWRTHHSQFITAFMRPYENGNPLARIDFAPDKCAC